MGDGFDQIAPLHRRARKFGDDSTLAHRENSVGNGENLFEIGRCNQDCFAARRKISNDVMDFVFCADVDALRRFVEKKHIGVRREPLRQNNLLLIAARQRPASTLASAGLIFKARIIVSACSICRAETERAGRASHDRHRNVFVHGQNHAKSGPDGPPGSRQFHHRSRFERKPARICGLLTLSLRPGALHERGSEEFRSA